MEKGEEATVCSLVERVFNEFVAPDYGAEGVETFFRYAAPAALAARSGPGQVIVVAERASEIAGVIEMVNHNHISLLFVSRRRQGIARELIRTAVETCRDRQPDIREITVNASPYAESAYGRLGFRPLGPVRQKSGIIFVPMVHDLK